MAHRRTLQVLNRKNAHTFGISLPSLCPAATGVRGIRGARYVCTHDLLRSLAHVGGRLVLGPSVSPAYCANPAIAAN